MVRLETHQLPLAAKPHSDSALEAKYPGTAHLLYHAEHSPAEVAANSLEQFQKIITESSSTSVNPAGTSKQNAKSVLSTFWATKACALPLQLASSFITTWHWHRDAPLSASIILSAFYPLAKIGPVRLQLIRNDMHKFFSELKWIESTGVQFETLSRGNILPLMHDLFDAGRLAMENFILFLSMLFNLRFKVQDALHRALMRSQAWLADCVNVMGIGSSLAQDFILYSHVLLAEDFHNALCQASRFPRHSVNLWLSELEAIPMIGRNSLRDIQLTQVKNNLAGHIS